MHKNSKFFDEKTLLGAFDANSHENTRGHTSGFTAKCNGDSSKLEFHTQDVYIINNYILRRFMQSKSLARNTPQGKVCNNMHSSLVPGFSEIPPMDGNSVFAFLAQSLLIRIAAMGGISESHFLNH